MLNVTADLPTSDIHTGLAGNATGWLELRLCSDARRTQIFRSRDGRCTVGSGHSCNVRLHAPGVAPVHCLIIRGHQCTVLRSFNPNTRLNGQPVEDAVLVAGDRLTIGCAELEIVTLDAGPPPQQRLRDALDDLSRLQDQLEQLEDAERAQREKRVLLQSQLESLDDQLAELEIRAAHESAAHKRREQELLDQLHALEIERDEARRQCELNQRQLEGEGQQRESLLRNLQDLESRIREVETELAIVQSERDGLARELAEREADVLHQREIQQQLDTLRTQFEQQQDRYQSQTSQWENERRAYVEQITELQNRAAPDVKLSPEFRALEEQLASEIAARTEAMQMWEEERAELMQEFKAAQNQINNYMQRATAGAEETAFLQQRCTELEQRLQDAQHDFEQKSLLTNDQQQLRSRELEQSRAQLQQEFESQRTEWLAEREQLQSLVHELTERCQLQDRLPAVSNSDPVAQPEEFTSQSTPASPWESELREARDRIQAAMGGLVMEEETLDQQDSFRDAEETYSPQEEQYSDTSTEEEVVNVDPNAVLERLRRVGLLRRENENDDDESLQSDVTPTYSDAGYDDAGNDRFNEPMNSVECAEEDTYIEPLAPQNAPAEEDESSIQQYMDRLLRRVRGSESPRPVHVVPVAAKTVARDDSAQDQAQPTEYVTAEEYVPRSSAPELTANLAAMRELANDSARKALTTYQRKAGTEGTRRFLTYSAVCFFAGLASILLLTQASTIVGITGGVLGFGSSAVLGVVAFARSARMRSNG